MNPENIKNRNKRKHEQQENVDKPAKKPCRNSQENVSSESSTPLLSQILPKDPYSSPLVLSGNERTVQISQAKHELTEQNNVKSFREEIAVADSCNMECWRFVPPPLLDNKTESVNTIFYIPGSAFSAYMQDADKAFSSNMACILNCQVITIFPKLTKQDKFPIPLINTINIINYFLANQKTYNINLNNTAIAGYSSGGLLAIQICILNHFQKNNHRFCHLILIAPITSLSYDPLRFQHTNDATFMTKDFFQSIIQNYVPNNMDVSNLIFSPILFPSVVFKDFLPTTIICGEQECLFADAEKFQKLLVAANSDVYSNSSSSAQEKYRFIPLAGEDHSFPWNKINYLEDNKDRLIQYFNSQKSALISTNEIPIAKCRVIQPMPMLKIHEPTDQEMNILSDDPPLNSNNNNLQEHSWMCKRIIKQNKTLSEKNNHTYPDNYSYLISYFTNDVNSKKTLLVDITDKNFDLSTTFALYFYWNIGRNTKFRYWFDATYKNPEILSNSDKPNTLFPNAMLNAQYINLARKLNLVYEQTDIATCVMIVIKWLKKQTNWMLVYDNVDPVSRNYLAHYFPESGGIVVCTEEKECKEIKENTNIETIGINLDDKNVFYDDQCDNNSNDKIVTENKNAKSQQINKEDNLEQFLKPVLDELSHRSGDWLITYFKCIQYLKLRYIPVNLLTEIIMDHAPIGKLLVVLNLSNATKRHIAPDMYYIILHEDLQKTIIVYSNSKCEAKYYFAKTIDGFLNMLYENNLHNSERLKYINEDEKNIILKFLNSYIHAHNIIDKLQEHKIVKLKHKFNSNILLIDEQLFESVFMKEDANSCDVKIIDFLLKYIGTTFDQESGIFFLNLILQLMNYIYNSKEHQRLVPAVNQEYLIQANYTLASILYKLGDLNAIVYADKAWKLLCEHHIANNRMKEMYGDMYIKSSILVGDATNIKNALARFDELLVNYRQKESFDYKSTLMQTEMLHEVAHLYQQQGNLDKAEELLNEASALLESEDINKLLKTGDMDSKSEKYQSQTQHPTLEDLKLLGLLKAENVVKHALLYKDRTQYDYAIEYANKAQEMLIPNDPRSRAQELLALSAYCIAYASAHIDDASNEINIETNKIKTNEEMKYKNIRLSAESKDIRIKFFKLRLKTGKKFNNYYMLKAHAGLIRSFYCSNEHDYLNMLCALKKATKLFLIFPNVNNIYTAELFYVVGEIFYKFKKHDMAEVFFKNCLAIISNSICVSEVLDNHFYVQKIQKLCGQEFINENINKTDNGLTVEDHATCWNKLNEAIKSLFPSYIMPNLNSANDTLRSFAQNDNNQPSPASVILKRKIRFFSPINIKSIEMCSPRVLMSNNVNSEGEPSNMSPVKL